MITKPMASIENTIIPVLPAKTGKGKKKVKKTRTYNDAKGYMVSEEYSSEEEVEL